MEVKNREDLSKFLKAVDNTGSYDNIDPIQKDNHNIYLIVGKKGSGKSTLLLNLLRSKKFYRRHYNNIYFISPSAKRDDKFEKLCEELTQEDKCFDECNAETIKDIIERVERDNDIFKEKQLKKKNKKKIHNLLILDDCISDLNKNSEIKNIVNKMVLNSRHLKLSIWVVSQKYKMISTAIRANADMLSFFNNHSDIEKKALEENGIDTSLLDLLEKPNDFLHVILRGAGKYYINLKPVLSVKDTKKNNPPIDKIHGGYVRGDETNDNDSVLCLLQTKEIVLPRKVVDNKMIKFLEENYNYSDKTGEFEK